MVSERFIRSKIHIIIIFKISQFPKKIPGFQLPTSFFNQEKAFKKPAGCSLNIVFFSKILKYIPNSMVALGFQSILILTLPFFATCALEWEELSQINAFSLREEVRSGRWYLLYL